MLIAKGVQLQQKIVHHVIQVNIYLIMVVLIVVQVDMCKVYMIEHAYQNKLVVYFSFPQYLVHLLYLLYCYMLNGAIDKHNLWQVWLQ